ncbi:monocarboxylate transporter 13-like isoform X2 [Argopecten irradians]|uniref:monocarboxylate transporter 13-like isoform X2 n=1 Tax=Argopecten irradians TaxID=31199 RepID=UPI0037116116
MGRVLSVKIVGYKPRDTKNKVERECLLPSRVKPDHIDRGWAWMIVLGCSVSHMLAIMMMSSFGILFVPVIEELGTTLDDLTIVSNIMYGATYFTVTMANPICGIVSCRAIMCSGGILLAGAFFSGYFILTFYSFVCMGAIAGVGGGLLISSSLMAIRNYFDMKRHIALALILVANGAGSVIGPPIITSLLDEFGLDGTFLVMSGIYLHSVAGGTLLRPISLYLPWANKIEVRERPNILKAYRVYIDKYLFGNILFYLCITSSFFYVIGFTVTYSRLPDHMTSLTHSLDEASTTLIIAGAANTFGKLVGMTIVEKIPRLTRFFYIGACVLSGGSLMTMPVCEGVSQFYAAAFGFGFFFGNIHYLGSMLFIEFFGPDKVSGCFGMLYMSYTLASFTGNPLAGMVAEMTSFPGAEFFFIGACIVFAGFVMIPSVCAPNGQFGRKLVRKDLESVIRPIDIPNINHIVRMAPLEITDQVSDKETIYGAVSLSA